MTLFYCSFQSSQRPVRVRFRARLKALRTHNMKIFFEFESKSSKGEIFILVAFIILIISARIYGILIKEIFCFACSMLENILTFPGCVEFLEKRLRNKTSNKSCYPFCPVCNYCLLWTDVIYSEMVLRVWAIFKIGLERTYVLFQL